MTVKRLSGEAEIVLHGKEAHALRHWFSFLERDDRMDVDHRLASRLARHAASTFSMTQKEAALAIFWFFRIPSVVQDASDQSLFTRLVRLVNEKA